MLVRAINWNSRFVFRREQSRQPLRGFADRLVITVVAWHSGVFYRESRRA